jgi:hypothetical protein
MPPEMITVVSKGDFGYHHASGQHLRKGEQYTIEKSAFSKELFDVAKGKQAAPAKPKKTDEGGNN